MAMKKVDELKKIFVGPKSVMYTSKVVDFDGTSLDVTPEAEFPVKVDSLKATMDDPTINHYKIIGKAGDWATTSELGDFNVEMVVPTNAKEVLVMMFGADAVKDIAKLTLKTGNTGLDATTGFGGVALEQTKYKMTGTIVIVDETETNLMVITNLALYATLQYDEPGSAPVAFKLSGSIEGAGKKSVAWFSKNAV